MMTRDEINQAIYKDGSVNREHILEFLRTIPTNDTMAIQAEVRTWLQTLHDDPYYSKISLKLRTRNPRNGYRCPTKYCG
jgi:hypothetical protein